MPRRFALLPSLLLSLLPGAAGAARPVVTFDDPAGDADGPGSYVLPASGDFTAGDFDLRRFAVSIDGEDVLLEVTLGAAVRRPGVAVREGSTPLELDAGIYLQNVDVYVDTEPSGAGGSGACLPGRRIAFADGRTWEAAVVLAPQPEAARAVAVEALGPAAGRVHFVERVRSRGRTLVARVPASALGGVPRPEWGWVVAVSGAAWGRTFSVGAGKEGEPKDTLTMPVLAVPERWAFGGAPVGDAHPRVLDVLLPAGVDQRAILGSFDAAAGSLARVPFLYGRPPGGAPVAAPIDVTAAGAGDGPAPARWTVADVAGDVVTVSGPPAGLAPLQIGRVLGPGGETAARVVVEKRLDAGWIGRAVEGAGRIARGAAVAFDPPEAPAAAP